MRRGSPAMTSRPSGCDTAEPSARTRYSSVGTRASTRAPATGLPPATSRARSVARRARRSATSTVDPGATAGSGFSAARSSIRAEMT